MTRDELIDWFDRMRPAQDWPGRTALEYRVDALLAAQREADAQVALQHTGATWTARQIAAAIRASAAPENVKGGLVSGPMDPAEYDWAESPPDGWRHLTLAEQETVRKALRRSGTKVEPADSRVADGCRPRPMEAAPRDATTVRLHVPAFQVPAYWDTGLGLWVFERPLHQESTTDVRCDGWEPYGQPSESTP